MLIRSTGASCPLCGANHATCGQPTTSTPIDLITREETTVATRKYRVTVRGTPTTMKLSDADLKAYPDAALVDEPDRDDVDQQPEPKARTASNKARGAATKAK